MLKAESAVAHAHDFAPRTLRRELENVTSFAFECDLIVLKILTAWLTDAKPNLDLGMVSWSFDGTRHKMTGLCKRNHATAQLPTLTEQGARLALEDSGHSGAHGIIVDSIASVATPQCQTETRVSAPAALR